MRRIILTAGAATMIAAMPLAPASATQAAAARPAAPATGVLCNSPQPFELASDGQVSWASQTSPYVIYLDANLTPYTGFCPQAMGKLWKFVQYGTSRCVVVNASAGLVEEGNCNSTPAEWNIIGIDSGAYNGDYLVQNWSNKACLKSNGINVSAGWQGCDGTSSNQAFNLTPAPGT